MEVLGLVPRAATAPFRPPAASDFALQGRANETRVLVLGAGVAGLAAAYELEKAGYRCQVLEARDRAGGRNWTVRDGTAETDLDGFRQVAAFAPGIYFNAGPARIPGHHVTMDYCRELGVPVEVLVNGNADAWLYHEGRGGARGPQAREVPARGRRAGGALTGVRIRQRTARADLYGAVAELLAKATHAGALDDDLAPGDREALVVFLRDLGALATGDRYRGSSRRGWARPPGAGTSAGELEEPFELPALLASGVGAHLSSGYEWDQAMPMFQPVGGMDCLPAALAGALRGPVRYGAEVRTIREVPDGVEVEYDRRGQRCVARADRVVCTLPPMALRAVATTFPPPVTQALAAARGVATGKTGLQYRRRFWETDERIFGGITWTNMDIGTIWYPSSGFLGERGLVVGVYNFGADAEGFAALPPAEREAHAVRQGMKVHGAVYRDELESSFSVSWSRIRHSEGGWVGWTSRGAGYRRLLEPVGRVHFAGDHLSHVTSWQHGALESARAAVTALHAGVLAAS
jgi:monoamine oxidase